MKIENVGDKVSHVIDAINPFHDNELEKLHSLVQSASIDQLSATSGESTFQIIKMINHSKDDAEKALEVMRKIMMSHKTPPTDQINIMTLLETCVKCANPTFQMNFALSRFWVEILECLPNPSEHKVTLDVQEKILECIVTWAKHLDPVQFQNGYGILLERAYVFPELEVNPNYFTPVDAVSHGTAI